MHCGAGRSLLLRLSLPQSRALSNTASHDDLYDVAIVGAGLTGAALAAGLGKLCLFPWPRAKQQSVVSRHTSA